MKKNKRNKFIKLILNKYSVLFCVFIFTIFWVFASILFNKQVGFTLLRQGYDYEFSNMSSLLKGQSIKGEFMPEYNNLGIVYVRFEEFAKINYEGEDILQFKIKNKNDKNWFYINNYRAGMLKDYLLFPFGFPIVKDSANKTYQFEIVSLNGNEKNSIKVSSINPSLMSGHKFEKNEILASKRYAASFLLTKLLNSFSSQDFILSSAFFAIPLIIYLLLILFLKSNYSINKGVALLVVLLFAADILFLKPIYVGLVLLIVTMWIFTVVKFKIKSNVSLFVALFLVPFWVIDTYLDYINFGFKINIWVYILLVIGAFQSIIELYNFKRLSKNIQKIKIALIKK